MKKEKWVWMPHAGHFCGADDCRFKMNTYVGKYIVSTVGEYYPKSLHDSNPTSIGYNRFYETMVFKAKKSREACCKWEVASLTELDFAGYNTSGEAFEGHMKLCKKWSEK